MAASEALAIERLGLGDVAGGLVLSDGAGWNQTADDWSFFITAGAAFGVRDEVGTLVATAAALPYDAATGWVSMVLVAPAHRHRGIAGQLVEACVASLRAGGRTPLLDATPAGAAVYAKIGFKGGFAFDRWQGGGGSDVEMNRGPEVVAVAARARESVRAAGPADIETVIDLDRLAGGVDRRVLWRAFLSRPDTRAWLALGASGVVVRRAGRRATQVGPIVATDADSALALLDAALADVAGAVFIDVREPAAPLPGRDPCAALADALARRGFVRQRSFVRMALGDDRASAARERVLAVAGPEFG